MEHEKVNLVEDGFGTGTDFTLVCVSVKPQIRIDTE